MPKINREEYEVLKGLDERAKTIVRQERGWLWVAEQPIMKDKWSWFVADGFDEKLEDDSLFQFIQWEDKEPYNIAELIEEYESEETEVKKDIEGLVKYLEKEISNFKPGQMIYDYLTFILKQLNQLDEPEVLTQELPVIPKFVADWIEKYIEYGYDLYPALKKMENNSRSWKKTYDWYRKNTRKFVIAYLTGKYKVEEEQKYVIELPNITGSDERYLVQGDDGDLWIDGGLDYLQRHDLPKHTFTEEEIKSFDTKYMTFAKPVEEME